MFTNMKCLVATEEGIFSYQTFCDLILSIGTDSIDDHKYETDEKVYWPRKCVFG